MRVESAATGSCTARGRGRRAARGIAGARHVTGARRPPPALTEGDLAIPDQLLEVCLLRLLSLCVKDDRLACRHIALLHSAPVPSTVIGPQHVDL